ncbi:MAG: hypothetical protein IJA26_08680 [Clostridia bacterium]|nr:hypothetical protein [Clostridia bacterium]
MKRLCLALLALFLLSGIAFAEGYGEFLSDADIGRIQSFSDEYSGIDIASITDDVAQGELGIPEEMENYLKRSVRDALGDTAGRVMAAIVPVLLLAVLGCAFPHSRGGVSGARFILAVSMLGTFVKIASSALQSAESCITASKKFTDVITPVLSAVTTAAGMNASAALVTPASALAGNIFENLFCKYGLAACRCALVLAAVGGLTDSIDLSSLISVVRKAVNWCCGLAGTLFAALAAVQNNIASSADSAAARTVKYTVDSFASIIGGGVSEAWNTYAAGVSIAKNAVGVSGSAAILAAGIRPVASILLSMLSFKFIAVFLDMIGEKRASRSCDQVSGVCQMALSLSCGSIVIAVILATAAMFAGRGFLF